VNEEKEEAPEEDTEPVNVWADLDNET